MVWNSIFTGLTAGFMGRKMTAKLCVFKPSSKVAGSLPSCLFWQWASALISWWLTFLFVALILYTIAFFRDPDRPDPGDQRAVVAAADGTVADIQEIDEKEFLKARSKRIGIFLSDL